MIFTCFNELRPIVVIDNSRSLLAQFHLEEGLVYHWYGNDIVAKKCFLEAQAVSGLKWDVTGVLGKRTKFQQFEISQLAIMASSSLEIEANSTLNAEIQILELNDDTLLEKTEFRNDVPSNQKQLLKGNLNPIDQAILLAFW